MDEVIKKEISDFLKNTKFKKQMFGGLNEMDVLNKINKLNDLYSRALDAERIRYDVLINEYKNEKKED